MRAHQAEHSISIMSRVLKLSRSGYYAWLKGDKSLREKENTLLSERIRVLHLESKGIYGCLLYTSDAADE